MAAFLPLGLAAASAIPSLISGIMGIANEAKKARGGRLRRRGVRAGIKHKRKGRGVVADTLGNVPLLGALLGPLARALGGRVNRRGKGLSPMYIRRPYVGMGLSPLGRYRGGALHHRKGYYKYAGGKRIHVRPTLVHGSGLSPMYIRRPYVGMGLLAPAGGAIHHRKGHYRKVNGHRVHVRPSTVHNGRALMITLPGYKKKAC